MACAPPRTRGRIATNRFFALAVLALAARQAPAAAIFTPGDVFATAESGDIWNVTAGGDFRTGAVPFADVIVNTSGDPAWSADRSTMYVSSYATGTVYAITPAGVFTPFATGLSTPRGLLTTSAGRLLVTEGGSGQITDITAGGNFTAAAPFASGLAQPYSLAQTPNGNIYAAEISGGEISDVTAGGVIGAAQVFASGINGVQDIIPAASGNGLFAAHSGGVFAISGTGVKTAFATGRGMQGLTSTAAGRLLASDTFTDAVYDVTAGGNLLASPVHARVNNVVSIQTVPIPEPASLALFALAAAAVKRRRR
jgi:hypothetical protein